MTETKLIFHYAVSPASSLSSDVKLYSSCAVLRIYQMDYAGMCACHRIKMAWSFTLDLHLHLTDDQNLDEGHTEIFVAN